ncbi:MAG: tetratricopeptide repeat protein [Pirellulales bacterium]|nr:tetratricopeptide repeat protein [Pirellulales bacterium]
MFRSMDHWPRPAVPLARRTVALLCRVIWLASLAASATPARAFPAIPATYGDSPPAISDADQPNDTAAAYDVGVFHAKTPRTEAQGERLTALAMYSAGRMHEEKQELPAALRMYERASRFDPAAQTPLRDAIRMAFSIGRSDEAIRYAVKLADLDASDPQLLRRLAGHVVGQGDLERGLKLYQRAADVEESKSKSAGLVLLWMQVGKLALILDQPGTAAAAYRRVQQALASPADWGLDDRARGLIYEDATKTLDLLGRTVDGRSPEAQTCDLFGKVLLEAGDLDAALAAYEQGHALAANAPLLALQRAEVLAARKETDAALAALDEFFASKRPQYGDAPFELLAKLLSDAGRAGDLRGRLERLQADQPDNVALAYFLADTLRQAGELPQAESIYIKALAAQPTLSGHRGLIDVLRRQGKIEPLLEAFLQCVPNVRTLDSLGDEGRALTADASVMPQLLTAAIARDEKQPLDTTQAGALGQLALSAGLFDAAEVLFTRAIERDRENAPILLRRWALALLVQDKFAEATSVIERMLASGKVSGDDAELAFHLSGALAMQNKHDEALGAARRAVELAEQDREALGDVYYRILARPGWVLYRGKRLEDAEREYESLIARFNDRHDDEAVREMLRDARLSLSNIAVLRGDTAASERWLEEILDEYPEDISAMNDLGYLWADAGKRLHLALAMIEQAVAKEPENAAYLDSHGWALFRLGRRAEAISTLQRAVSQEKDPDGVILEHLGDAYLADGRVDDARAAWQRALAAFTKLGDAAKSASVQKKLDQHPPAAP